MAAQIHRDLTQGSVIRQLLAFSIPFMLSNALQALYNVIDMLIVGWFLGSDGIAAVGISGQIMMLAQGAIMGLSMGGTVMIAQYVGIRRFDQAGQTIGTILSIFAVAGVALTILGLLLCTPLLNAIHTPPEAMKGAQDFLNVSLYGLIFVFGYNGLSGILRGMGDSKRPLYFVAIATLVNIALDFIFIGVCHMGPAGAGLATITAQALSCVLTIVYLKRQDFIFDFKLRSFRFYRDKMRMILKIGLPSSIQMLINGTAGMLVASLINSFGVAAAAAFGIGMKVDSFAILPALAISSAISSMGGQNLGAEKFDRAKKTLKNGMMINWVVTGAIFILVQLFARTVILAFTNDPEVLNYGVVYMRYATIGYILLSTMFCFNGLSTAAGDTLFTLGNMMVNTVAGRVLMAYLFASFLGYTGVVLAMGVSPILGILGGFGYYLSGKWKKSRVKADRIAEDAA